MRCGGECAIASPTCCSTPVESLGSSRALAIDRYREWLARRSTSDENPLLAGRHPGAMQGFRWREGTAWQCAGCGAVLTAAASEVALPVHLRDTHWERSHPPLLKAGTYAVDPKPYGPPWRTWEEFGRRRRQREESSPRPATCPTDRRTPSSSHPATCAAPDSSSNGPRATAWASTGGTGRTLPARAAIC